MLQWCQIRLNEYNVWHVQSNTDQTFGKTGNALHKILITMKHWTFLLFLLTKKNIKNLESVLVATV